MTANAAKILIVEDDAAQRRTLCDILRAEGFDTVACSNGSDALDLAGKQAFSVAVLDQRLPDLNGTQLLVQLRTLSESLRAIIHTAYGSFESARDAVNLGAYAFVEKVGDPGDLIQEVRRAMEEAVAEQLLDLDGSFRSITEFAPDPILQLARDGSICFVNHNLAGIPLRDMRGSTLREWIVDDRRDTFDAALEAVFEEAETAECEIALDDAYGMRHWYECRIGPSFSRHRVIRAVVVAREVTRRKLRKRIDRILSVLHHDARTAIGDQGFLSIGVSSVVLTNEFVARNPGARIGPHTLITASNSGCGRSAEDVERLFEPFESSRDDSSGNEFGLINVYTEVARAGGHIEIVSEPEEGTTFHIYLPEVG